MTYFHEVRYSVMKINNTPDTVISVFWFTVGNSNMTDAWNVKASVVLPPVISRFWNAVWYTSEQHAVFGEGSIQVGSARARVAAMRYFSVSLSWIAVSEENVEVGCVMLCVKTDRKYLTRCLHDMLSAVRKFQTLRWCGDLTCYPINLIPYLCSKFFTKMKWNKIEWIKIKWNKIKYGQQQC